MFESIGNQSWMILIDPRDSIVLPEGHPMRSAPTSGFWYADEEGRKYCLWQVDGEPDSFQIGTYFYDNLDMNYLRERLEAFRQWVLGQQDRYAPTRADIVDTMVEAKRSTEKVIKRLPPDTLKEIINDLKSDLEILEFTKSQLRNMPGLLSHVEATETLITELKEEWQAIAEDWAEMSLALAGLMKRVGISVVHIDGYRLSIGEDGGANVTRIETATAPPTNPELWLGIDWENRESPIYRSVHVDLGPQRKHFDTGDLVADWRAAIQFADTSLPSVVNHHGSVDLFLHYSGQFILTEDGYIVAKE